MAPSRTSATVTSCSPATPRRWCGSRCGRGSWHIRRGMGCVADDDLLELVRGGALGERPTIEAHLAGCAACSALVAALLAGERDAGAADRWGALVGETLGPYRLEGQIGAGAAGAVYRAWDERLRRRVAIKVLLEDGAH